MKTITVINAKGGCGKSTIAAGLACAVARRGYRTLLIDLDPQAQITEWFGAGTGLDDRGTITEAIRRCMGFGADAFSLQSLAHRTQHVRLGIVPSSQGLEDLGRQIVESEGYCGMLARSLARWQGDVDLVVIDSPNQVSPIMELALQPADLLICPFESGKAVRSYANFWQLVLKLHPKQGGQPPVLHVLSNLSQPGLRNEVVAQLKDSRLDLAHSEIRHCGWLARVDAHGGDIFNYRPLSKGAEDMSRLSLEALRTLSLPSRKSLDRSKP